MDLHAELQLLAGKRISVKTLAQESGVALRVAEARSAKEIRGVAFGHVLIAENGDPLRKLRSFDAALGEHAHIDLALLKFCYVDVKAGTDAKALFARYREALEKMQAKNPRTVFVHATVPLTTAESIRGARAGFRSGTAREGPRRRGLAATKNR